MARTNTNSGGGGGGTPFGSNGWVQYNRANLFYADADFYRDPTTHETFIGRDMANPGQQAGWVLQDNVLFGMVPFVGNAWIDNVQNGQTFNGIIDTTAFGGLPGAPFMIKGLASGDQGILILNQNDPTGSLNWGMNVNNTAWNNTRANLDLSDTNSTLQFQDQGISYTGRVNLQGNGIDITYGTAGNAVGMFFEAGDLGWGYNARRYHLPTGIPTLGQVLGVTNVSLPNVTLDWVTTSGSSLVGYTEAPGPTGNTALGDTTAPASIGYANVWIGVGTGQNWATGNRNTLLGAYVATAATDGVENVLIGYQTGIASNSLNYTTLVGGEVTAAVNINYATALGSSASVQADAATAIGYQTLVNADKAIALGAQAQATGISSIAIGHAASTVGHNGSIVMGDTAIATDSYQFVVGSTTTPITNMYLGYGVQGGLPIDVKIHGSDIQTGTTDQSAGSMYLIPGLSTGAAYGGTLYVQSSLPGASGSTPNLPSTWAQFGPGYGAMGDISGAGTGTKIESSDLTRINNLVADNWTQFMDSSGNIYMRVSSVDRLTRIGDVFSGSGNGTVFDTDDANQWFKFVTDGTFFAQNKSGVQAFNLDLFNRTAQLGWAPGIGSNGNGIFVDDQNHDTRVVTDSIGYFSVKGGSNILLQVNASSRTATLGDALSSTTGTKVTVDVINSLVTITNVPTYANDSAATGAGLTSGQLYKTTTGGITSLNIVP